MPGPHRVAGVVVTFILFWITAPLQASEFDVVLTEIHYHPLSGNSADEFLELYNRGGTDVDLSGWVFVRGVRYIFPDDTVLRPKQYLVVSPDPAYTRVRYGLEKAYGPWDGRLDDSGEVLALVDREGEEIVRVHWGDGAGWADRPDGAGPSLELADPFLEPEIPQHWYPSRFIDGTPGRPNDIRLPDETRDVVINEVVESDGASSGYVELFNRGDEPVDIGGYRLRASSGEEFVLPARELAPGERTHFLEGEVGIAIRLAGMDWALARDGRGEFADAISPRGAPTGSDVRAFGRVPDGQGSGYLLATPTPGASNEVELEASVVIHEILFHPPAVAPSVDCSRRCSDPDQWIELHNRSASAVSLAGWSLSSAVDFDFASGASIGAFDYLVIAADRARFLATHPGVTAAKVVGDFDGRLSHGSETIRLRNALGNEVDEVEYGDGSPVNDESPADDRDDRTFHGSEWPAGSQGTGRSIEFVNPALDNALGRAWREGPIGGTPGAANDAFESVPAPAIGHFRHEPAVPRSNEAVTVRARVSAAAPLTTVEVRYSRDGGGGAGTADLRDDGVAPDENAGDGVYTGTVPPQPNNTVVRLQVRASAAGEESIAPAPFPVAPYPGFEGPFYLYQVLDDAAPTAPSANYWIVMTQADQDELADRPVTSDVLLPATFISLPGPGFASSKEPEVRQVVGIRYRGESSRRENRKAYRVRFHPEARFLDIEELNLNARDIDREILAADIFRRAGMPAPLAWTVNLTFAGDLDARYVRKEKIDEDFLSRWFGGARADGNLYRALDPTGRQFPEQGDLRWLGSDPDEYRPYYAKESNKEEADWSDVVELCRAFARGETSDADFPAEIRRLIDVKQWARFFAIQTCLGNPDGSIQNQTGEDYFLYRIPVGAGTPDAGLWVLIPWDLEESFSEDDEPLFGSEIDAIRRFLTDEDFAPSYWCELAAVREGAFSRRETRQRFSLIRELFDFARLDGLDAFITARLGFIDRNVPRGILVRSGPAQGIALIPPRATWSFFRGTSEPSGGNLDWALPGFDDSSWESGPAGFGYGDNDDATVLSDMEGNYTTVYIRHEFEVDDAASLASSLRLQIDYDDGFIAWLNGVELARAEVDGQGPAPFDGTAHGHEAGTVESFTLAAQGVLHDGVNVFAIQGVNSDLGSSDFSLDPVLLSGGSEAGGCGIDLWTTGSAITLDGTVDACVTRSVRVDGQEVDYSTFLAEWSATLSVPAAGRTVTVEAIDASGSVIEAVDVSIRRLDSLTTIGGTLPSNRTLARNTGPYLLDATLRIPAGRTLAIEPGVEIYGVSGASIVVAGSLQIEGEPALPVRLRAQHCDGRWGGIAFDGTGTGANDPDQLIRYAEVEYAREPNGFGGCIAAVDSKLVVESSSFRHITANAIDATDSRLEVRSSEFVEIEEGVHGTRSTIIVTDCYFEGMVGDKDAIDFDGDGDGDERSRIERCRIFHGSDDGIDLGRTSVDIRDNVFFDVQDKAVSIEGRGQLGEPVITGNIVFACGSAIALKNGVRVSEGHHNTLVGNQEGLTLFAKADSSDGGHGVFHSNIIWNNAVDVSVDALSTLDLSFSDVSSDIFPGDGNISADPLFRDVHDLDFALRGGSPCIATGLGGTDMGAVPFDETGGTFLRGDADSSGGIDITDAVFTLGHLFQGGPEPPCLDAADSNDDGRLDISDPVRTLLFLFAGGEPPPAPYPDVGPDPSPDSLDCF